MIDDLARQIEAIIRDMIAIDLHYRRLQVTIDADGRTTYEWFWTDKGAEMTYAKCEKIIALLAKLHSRY